MFPYSNCSAVWRFFPSKRYYPVWQQGLTPPFQAAWTGAGCAPPRYTAFQGTAKLVTAHSGSTRAHLDSWASKLFDRYTHLTLNGYWMRDTKKKKKKNQSKGPDQFQSKLDPA